MTCSFRAGWKSWPRPRVVWETTFAPGVCALVQRGMGVGLVDMFTAHDLVGKGLTFRLFEPEMMFHVGIHAPGFGCAPVESSGGDAHQRTDREETEITADLVIVDMGTVPDTELFGDLRDRSGNAGVTDLGALIANRPQPRAAEGFELHRIGDAQASRNIHAAIYDAFRLCHVA